MKEKCPSNDRKGKKAKPTQNAQGLVEFALILPVVLVTIFVLIELARVLHAWLAIENGARAAVRYAVTAEYNPAHCPGGVCDTPAEENQARVASIHDAAWAGSSTIVRVGWDEAEPDEISYFDVIVCDPEKIVAPASTFETHSCPDGEDPGEPGERVVVVVEFNHPLLSPLFTSIWPQLRLSAEREAKVETYRIPLPVGTAPAYNSPTPRPTNTPLPSPTPAGPLPKPDCDDVQFWALGNVSEQWVAVYVGAFEEGDPPPGIYTMEITYVEISQHTDPPSAIPELDSLIWTTWNTSGGSSTDSDTLKETSGWIQFWPDPHYNLGYCHPNCPEDFHYLGKLTLDFNGPLTKTTNVKVVVDFVGHDVQCSGWRTYHHPGFPKDTPEPYVSNTPDPNPATDTPTVVWYTPIPTNTPDPNAPDD